MDDQIDPECIPRCSLLDLWRPADVLIEGAVNGQASQPGASLLDRLALDVKVINAVGASHASATAEDPLAAMATYHDQALAHQQTAALCQAQGITYVPLVFSVQSGMAKRAEAVLHQLAAKVAEVEGQAAHEAFGEIADTIFSSLARHGARATVRRAGGQGIAAHPEASRVAAALWQAAGGSAPVMADAVSAEDEEQETDDPPELEKPDVPMA